MRIKRVTYSWMGLKRMCTYNKFSEAYIINYNVSLHKTVKACNSKAIILARSILFEY